MDDRNLEDWGLNPPDYEEMPDEPEVEPCPFCGKEPELRYFASWDKWEAGCRNRDCWLWGAEFTTIENWNKRRGIESEGE